MKKCLVLIIALIFQYQSYAQSREELLRVFKLAEDYKKNNDFENAIPIYQQLLDIDRRNANIQHKIGYCYLHIQKQEDKAIEYLLAAAKKIADNVNPESFDEKHAPYIVNYYLAEAYHYSYQFDKAIEMYGKYKSRLGPDDIDFVEIINREIYECETGKILYSNPVNIIELNIGQGINSEFDDYNPLISADGSTFVFTSKRKGGFDNGNLPDIYICNSENGLWTKPVSIGKNINTSGIEACIGLSIDGNELFIYNDEDKGTIYSCQRTGNGWSDPRKLGPTINTKAHETHASLSPDGQYLYFTSDRKAGFGGLDIYRSKLNENGQWGEAENLGANINTKFDEENPFIHPDGITLYFSSKGHKGIGGFDIFSSTLYEDNIWSNPKNPGYPVNSTNDDIFCSVAADGKRAFYASYKAEDNSNLDLYMITFVEKPEAKLTLINGISRNQVNELITNTSVSVFNLATGESLTKTEANPATGNFLISLQPGKKYLILYEAPYHLFSSEIISVPQNSSFTREYRQVELPEITNGKTYRQYNVKFTNNQAIITKETQKELNTVIEYCQKYNSLIVEIECNTDEQLSERRAKTIQHRLLSANIDSSRVKISNNINLQKNITIALSDFGFIKLRNADYEIVMQTDNTEKIPGAAKTIINKLSQFLINNSTMNITIPVIESDSIENLQSEQIIYALVESGARPDQVTRENKQEKENNYSYKITPNRKQQKPVEKNITFILSNLSDKTLFSCDKTNRSNELNSRWKQQLKPIILKLSRNKNLLIEIEIKHGDQTAASYLTPLYLYFLDNNISFDRIVTNETGNDDLYRELRVTLLDKALNKTFKHSYLFEFENSNCLLSEYSENEFNRLVSLINRQGELTVMVPLPGSAKSAKSHFNYIIQRLIDSGISKSRLSSRAINTETSEDIVLELKIGTETESRLAEETNDSAKENHQNQNSVRSGIPVELESIFFDYGKYNISEDIGNLRQLAKYLRDNQDAVTEISTYSDSRGSAEYNKVLTLKRADFIRNYLIRRGVKHDRIIVMAYGEENPIALEKNPDGSWNEEATKYNRRADIKVFLSQEEMVFSEIKIPPQLDLRYTIVIAREKEELHKDFFSKYPDLSNVQVYKTGDEYVYTIGHFVQKTEAIRFLKKTIDLGFAKSTISKKYEIVKN